MKCDKCKTNDANFHSINNINGKITEKHLCSECAKGEKEFEINTNSFLNDFMSDFKTSFSYSLNPLLELGFDDFFEDDFFSSSFKRNENRESLNNEYGKKLEEREKLRKELSEKEKKNLEIKKLDIELKKAVVEERYEDAIVLRDKIKKLKEN